MDVLTETLVVVSPEEEADIVASLSTPKMRRNLCPAPLKAGAGGTQADDEELPDHQDWVEEMKSPKPRFLEGPGAAARKDLQ